MASIILSGLEKVLEISCCSMIMPTIKQIEEGEEFSDLTHSLSGVGAVLRVSILSGIRNGEVSGTSLGELAANLMEEGNAKVSLWKDIVGAREY